MPLIRKDPEQPATSQPPELRDALKALTEGTREERRAAAHIVANAAVGAESLGRALFSETDPRVREAIFTGLARIRTADSVQAVIPHIRSDDPSMRTGALDALRAMPDAVTPYIGDLLSDPDPDVRLLVCEVARVLPMGEANTALCALLDREQDANVCAAVIDVLAEIGQPEVLPVLARCKQRFGGLPFLNFAITVATDRIGVKPPGET